MWLIARTLGDLGGTAPSERQLVCIAESIRHSAQTCVKEPLYPRSVGADGIDLAIVHAAQIFHRLGQLTAGALQVQRHAAFIFGDAGGDGRPCAIAAVLFTWPGKNQAYIRRGVGLVARIHRDDV